MPAAVKTIKRQIKTMGIGGVLTGSAVAYYSPHVFSNVPFLIGVITVIIGITVLLGK